MTKRMSAKEARSNFADLLGSVHYTKEAVIIEKQGRPFAVLVSPEDFDRMQKDRQARFAVLNEIRLRNSAVTPEEADEDAMREVVDLRQERNSRTRKAGSA